MKLRDVIDARKRAVSFVESSKCLQCTNFIKHVSSQGTIKHFQRLMAVQFAMCHDEWLIKENIVQLRQLMSDQNLQLLPDYEQRIQVLKDLDFIDESSRVQLKGKVACEVSPVAQLLSKLTATDSFC